MATVNILSGMPEYKYWADFFEPDASTLTAHTATTYSYTRSDGTRIAITGTGFLYDPDDPSVPIGGTITSIVVRNAANVAMLSITGLSADAVDFYYRVNGYSGDSGQDGSGFQAISALLTSNDVVNGSENGDDISAGTQEGNDTIHANGGDDFVKGDRGNDTIDGGAGWDTLSYQETIYGHGSFRGIVLNTATGVVTDSWNNTDHISNFEEYRGSSFADSITGSAAEDEEFAGLRGADTINGGAGWDLVGYNNDARFGGAKGIKANLTTHKIIDGWGQTDTVTNVEAVRGTAKNDSFVGSAGDDSFEGLAGIDSFNGGGGFDFMNFNNINWNGATHGVTVNLALATGQIVNDGFDNSEPLVSIEGIGGSRFADTLTGGSADDFLRGRDGNDIINGGVGADEMRGGVGYDVYTVDNAGDFVDELRDDGAGIDTVKSSRAFNLGSATQVEGSVENLTLLGSGNIAGTGNSLANVITGNAGINTLNGGSNNDTLNGGLGNDTLIGGSGSDKFLFNSALNATTNLDTITDFNVAADTIQLDDAIFTGLAVGTLTAAAFFIGAAAHDSSDRIVYNSTTGALIFDSNGNASGGAIQFATLTAGLALTNADFVVI
jgi:serralysin